MADRWTEARLQRWFIAECRRYKLFVAKVVSPSFRGFPDVVVSSSDVRVLQAPAFVELKTSEGRLSRVQEFRLADMKAAGMDVRVYYGKAHAEEFFNGFTRLT